MHPTRSKVIKSAIVFLAVRVFSACIEVLYFNYHALRYPDNSKVVLSNQELMSASTGLEHRELSR